jgi:hypothetical protein
VVVVRIRFGDRLIAENALPRQQKAYSVINFVTLCKLILDRRPGSTSDVPPEPTWPIYQKDVLSGGYWVKALLYW